MRSSILSLFVTVMVGGAAACTSAVDVHGNAPPPERLELIKVGRFTKSEVSALLGTPSNTSTFGDDNWYYISNRVETFAFFEPTELDRQIVAITFDNFGRVSEIRKLTLKDGKEVAMNSRETPTAGKDLTVLEQLLGNVGRFNVPKGKSGDSM